jgi:hypothetical protein
VRAAGIGEGGVRILNPSLNPFAQGTEGSTERMLPLVARNRSYQGSRTAQALKVFPTTRTTAIPARASMVAAGPS